MSDDKKIEEAADETSSWIQDAVGDMGNSPFHTMTADEMYNDEDTLSDLLGDHIFDHATQIVGSCWIQHDGLIASKIDPEHTKCFIKICEEMLEGAHTPMRNVLEKFITERREGIIKL